MVSQGICKESRKASRLRGVARTRLLSSRLFRLPGLRAAKCRRGDLGMTSRTSRDDGGRHWDSGMRSEESEASQPSGNPANKANRSPRINRYKIGRHHRGFEAPTRSHTFTTRGSTRRAPVILGESEGAPSSASHLSRRKMLLPQSGISMTTSKTRRRGRKVGERC